MPRRRLPLSSNPAAIGARQRRIHIGLETEAAAKAFSKPSLQAMIQLPLLEELELAGGKARPGEIYERIAARLGYPDDALDQNRPCGDGKSYNIFQQQVRWARQTAVMQGLIAADQRGIWELADPGFAKLQKARRGTTVLIYRVSDGLALWGHAEDIASTINKGSLKLILTSPPYPVISRAYGRLSVPAWLDWMSNLTNLWKDLLTDDGTLAVNLMDVFVSGTPALSPYIERFTLSAIDKHGLNLAGRMPWHSPAKLANIQWSVKERVRPRNTLEHILLFSKSPNPSWDIDRLPRRPAAARSAQKAAKDAQRSAATRPSGYNINPTAFTGGKDGSLPGNLIIAGGASGNDVYSQRCRHAGIPAHPARYPEAVPRSIILLTTEPGDICYDPMAGSNTTGKVASELGRRFISSDVMLSYVNSSKFRFDSRPDFQHHFQREYE